MCSLPCLFLQIGGTPAVLKYLLERNLIDGSCLTVTGECVRRWLARARL